MAFAAVIALNAACLSTGGPADPMFQGDYFLLGRPLELLPDVPWITAGQDGRLGTEDDSILFSVTGDVDLAVRTGVTEIGTTLPPPSPLRGGPPLAVAEPFGSGVPIDFAVTAMSGTRPDGGVPVLSPAVANVPVLAVAFADLDGDGYVGVTALDGGPDDTELEERELIAVGRRFAPMSGSRAAGQLFVAAGGPAGARLSVVVTAAAYTGSTHPEHFGGVVPTGPAVLAAFPFLPRTDPDRVLDGNLPGPASVDELVGVEIEEVFNPDPTQAYGEAFTVPTDGSEVSTDLALAHSGQAVRFGLARVAPMEPARHALLRPGLAADGTRLLYEVLDALVLSAGASPRTLRLVPLDRLGNIADLAAPVDVTLRATGRVQLLGPDLDADPTREVVSVTDARGVAVTLDGAGEGTGPAGVVIEDGSGVSLFEVLASGRRD
jgi:hypothetical protein